MSGGVPLPVSWEPHDVSGARNIWVADLADATIGLCCAALPDERD